MEKITKKQTYTYLVNEIASLIEEGRKTAVRVVNTTIIITYWLIGRRIIEYEQKGQERAIYGEALLEKLSLDLTKRFGKGWGLTNLKTFRQFYLTYTDIIQKSHTACDQLITNLTNQKGHTVCDELEKEIYKKTHSVFAKLTQPYEIISENFNILAQNFQLSWSHYRLLMRIEEPFKREFYETECIHGNWSVRQLDRQIQSMLYERTALSRRKLSVIAKAHKIPIILKPEDEIKNPYILEFLGLKDEYSESQLEDALIKHLEHFLLELGTGFTFVARQKRITIEGRHYRLDLLLYHRILKCLVAIDLKIGEFTHADAGQMNLYLNYLKDKEKFDEENEPVGLILCSDKKKTIVEYALGGLNNKIFASKYKLQLPDLNILKSEIETEKQRLIEMKIIKEIH